MRLMIVPLMVVFSGVITHAQAPSSRSSNPSTTGVVKSVSASSLTIEHDGVDVGFRVGSSTRFVRRDPPHGAGRYPNGANDLVLRPPPTMKDLLKAGERVTVTFRHAGASLQALEVRVLPAP